MPNAKRRPTRDRHFTPAQHADHPTLQHQAQAADINFIVNRWLTTGNPPEHVNLQSPKWGDFSSAGTYHEMATRTAAVTQSFAALPSATRKRFDNSPELLMEFLADPAQRPEAVELGLLAPRDDDEPFVDPNPTTDPVMPHGMQDTDLTEDPKPLDEPAPTDSRSS